MTNLLSEDFSTWLTLIDLENLFWEHRDAIHNNSGWLAVRHPGRRADKLTEEILPLIMLAKNETGRHKNWDSQLEIKVNINDTKTDNGEEFDAKYRWRSHQERPFGADLREGFIEVTMCQIDTYQEVLKDEYLYTVGPYTGDAKFHRESGKVAISDEGKSRDIDAGSPEMQQAVLDRLTKKIPKDYPENTTLVLWVYEEENQRMSNNIFSDESFLSKLTKVNDGKFEGIFLIGLSTFGRWVVGDGLS